MTKNMLRMIKKDLRRMLIASIFGILIILSFLLTYSIYGLEGYTEWKWQSFFTYIFMAFYFYFGFIQFMINHIKMKTPIEKVWCKENNEVWVKWKLKRYIFSWWYLGNSIYLYGAKDGRYNMSVEAFWMFSRNIMFIFWLFPLFIFPYLIYIKKIKKIPVTKSWEETGDENLPLW